MKKKKSHPSPRSHEVSNKARRRAFSFCLRRFYSVTVRSPRQNDEYYETLRLSSENWHNGHNDDTPFVKYLLGIILSAYRDFEERLDIVAGEKSAKEMVKEVFDKKLGKVTKSDIMEYCSTLSRSAVEKALRELVGENIIFKREKGPATYYILNI